MQTQSYKPTARQVQATEVLASGKHVLLYGGSRSGKTFEIVRATAVRALKAARSRHAFLRLHLIDAKQKLMLDTFPKVMEVCFPQVDYTLNKADLYATLQNGSEIWFGGLDDKERTDKILGAEYATIVLNEASQIGYDSRNTALTRLAQKCVYKVKGSDVTHIMPTRMYYDCNPPNKGHWLYSLFMRRIDPASKQPLVGADGYVSFQMNPRDNVENLPPDYLATLEGMPARMRKRFLEGEFGDTNPNALWTLETVEKSRVLDASSLPDMLRIVVAVDPSGADDDSEEADAIGIMVGGLGVDGVGYLFEDLTVKAGPATWGRVVASAYERHEADRVVAETNYGGAMVQHVVRSVNPRIPYKSVTASRGKVVRAEPISSLHEQGKIKLVGHFPELEDELQGFTTHGYIGDRSPNRADAFVWLMSEFFPGIVVERNKREPLPIPRSEDVYFGLSL